MATQGILRFGSILVASMLACLVVAQSTTLRYRAYTEPIQPSATTKGLITAIVSLLPDADLERQPNGSVLDISTSTPFTFDQLQQHAQAAGHRVISLHRLNGTHRTDIPVHEDTGNEREDHRRYDAAKAAYIQGHPEYLDVPAHANTTEQ